MIAKIEIGAGGRVMRGMTYLRISRIIPDHTVIFIHKQRTNMTGVNADP